MPEPEGAEPPPSVVATHVLLDALKKSTEPENT